MRMGTPSTPLSSASLGGAVRYDNLIENVTYRTESDEQIGLQEKIIIESKDRTKVAEAKIVDAKGEIIKSYSLPVGLILCSTTAQSLSPDRYSSRYPAPPAMLKRYHGRSAPCHRAVRGRNPSNPAIVSEIDGEVTYGKMKRGNREIIVTSRLGEEKKYNVPLSKQLLVQENDFVKAKHSALRRRYHPSDILNIMPRRPCRSISSTRCKTSTVCRV